jgi:hypothetical protein
MEASYATELQWAGQDKRYNVASEVVHSVQVAKGKAQGGWKGVVNMIMDLTSSTKG